MIMNMLKEAKFSTDPRLKQMYISLSMTMAQVSGRVLPAPILQYTVSRLFDWKPLVATLDLSLLGDHSATAVWTVEWCHVVQGSETGELGIRKLWSSQQR